MTPERDEACQKFFNWFAEKQAAKMRGLCLSHIMYGGLTCAGLMPGPPTKEDILTDGINKRMKI